MANASPDETPKAFLGRVLDAVLRIGALFLFGFIHYFLEQATKRLAPEGWDTGVTVLDDISFVVFGLIYVYLLWDLLKVFIPGFARWSIRRGEKK